MRGANTSVPTMSLTSWFLEKVLCPAQHTHSGLSATKGAGGQSEYGLPFLQTAANERGSRAPRPASTTARALAQAYYWQKDNPGIHAQKGHGRAHLHHGR